LTAGLFLGAGLGGLFQGILFYQILQLHHSVSNALFPNNPAFAMINLFWDGIFYIFCWTLAAWGTGLLWRWRRSGEVSYSGSSFFGSMLVGWGSLIVVENLIGTHLLELHHVVELSVGDQQRFWDFAYLGLGVALQLIGFAMVFRGRRLMARRSAREEGAPEAEQRLAS
jgi:uncharacterized membrane protein